MNDRLWTVARFPNGSWSYGGKPTDPDYKDCEVFRVSAFTGKAAVKKAQSRRSRERRSPVGQELSAMSHNYRDTAKCPRGHRFVVVRRSSSAGKEVATYCRQCEKQYKIVAGPVPA